MAKEKQYVFSARTTEEGLRLLNRLKAEKGIGWVTWSSTPSAPTTGWTGE